MTQDQSTALRLADALDQQFPEGTAQRYLDGEAAAELRRLHEINEAFGKRQEWWNERMFTLEAENEALKSEVIEQARIIGMGAERELKLIVENEALRAELQESRYLIESWGSYASDYFQIKHDLQGDLDRIDAALARAGETK